MADEIRLGSVGPGGAATLGAANTQYDMGLAEKLLAAFVQKYGSTGPDSGRALEFFKNVMRNNPPKAGESASDYAKRVDVYHSGGVGIKELAELYETSPDGMADATARTKAQIEASPEFLQRQAELAQQAKITGELQAFYNAYKTPLQFDASGLPTDPIARLLVQGGMGAAGNAAAKAGLDPAGGLGSLAVADQAQKSLIPYQQFREGMASNALGLMNQRDLGLSGLALGQRQLNEQGRQFDAGASMQDQANQYNAQRGLGSTIGSAIGVGLGGLATVLTGGAAAPLIPGLASLGGSIGGTAAGSSVPSSGYGPARPYGSGRGY